MSIGNQLNIFAAKARQYGEDWRGIIVVSTKQELRCAYEDACDMIPGAEYNHSTRVLRTPTGARLFFALVISMGDMNKSFAGREFTQIAWLHRPNDPQMREYARMHLRSRSVPADDLRYEYVSVR